MLGGDAEQICSPLLCTVAFHRSIRTSARRPTRSIRSRTTSPEPVPRPAKEVRRAGRRPEAEGVLPFEVLCEPGRERSDHRVAAALARSPLETRWNQLPSSTIPQDERAIAAARNQDRSSPLIEHGIGCGARACGSDTGPA